MGNNVITVNGQTIYTGSSNSITVINNEVSIDGQVIDMQKKQRSILDLIKGDSSERPVIINVVIHGDVQSVKLSHGDVEVTGAVAKAESVHGNVKVAGSVGDAKSVGGSVSVTGDAQSIKNVHGAINVGGNVTRTIHTVHGAVNVKGSWNS